MAQILHVPINGRLMTSVEGVSYRLANRGRSMKVYVFSGIVLAATLLSGCMFHPQTVHLDPQVHTSKSGDGHSTSLAIVVHDERATQDLGHRGNGMASAAAITSDADVANVVKQALTTAFADQGFTVTGSSPTTISVSIRALQTQMHQGFFTGHQEAIAAAKVVVTRSNRSYEHFYRVDSTKSKFWVATADQNSDYINSALSNLMDKIVNDEQLTKFLETKD